MAYRYGLTRSPLCPIVASTCLQHEPLMVRLQTSSESEAVPADETLASMATKPRRQQHGVQDVINDTDPVPTGRTSESLRKSVPEELARFLETNAAEGKEQFQQSLELFDDGTGIADSPSDIVLKKGSQRIRSEVSLTLLQKKLFNALLFVARPNLTKEGMFSVPVDYLSWCVSHDRSDLKYLKDAIRAMKKVVIEIENSDAKPSDPWFMTNLLADAGFDGRNLVWDFPALIRRNHSAPQRYFYISMVVNARFRSKYSLSLYEMLKEYEFRGETPWMTIPEFRERVGVEKHEYLEFKRLSERVIVSPLKELEEVSDFKAEVAYQFRGRKIIGIKFSIAANKKNQLEDGGDRIRPEYWTMMKDEFGLNRNQIDELTRAYPSSRVEEICDVLFYHYIVGKKKIGNGYRLMAKALQDEGGSYHLTNRQKNELLGYKERQETKTFDQQMLETQQRQHAKRVVDFQQAWAGWTKDQQQKQWHLFLNSVEAGPLITTRIIKGHPTEPQIDHPGIKPAFIGFLTRTGQIGE